MENKLAVWEAIGLRNPWIESACDPPFTDRSFSKCDSIEELKKNISEGNWCLGQAFYFENLCFINQVNGGDEWLTIKDYVAFESITFEGTIKEGKFEELIERLLAASTKDCLELNY